MADTVVKFGADITALQAGLAKSRSAVKSWGSGIGNTLKGGLAGALGVAAVGAAITGIVKEFADLSDAADRAGVSVKFLLSIKDDAEQTGASLETAAKSVKKFLIELNDPNAGVKMGGVLKALGTDVETLRQKQPEELFNVLAQAIGGVDTQGEKLALLGVLLGDTGGKFESILPLLEKVATDGVRPVSEEMVQATKDAAALDDEFDGVVSTVKTAVLPIFINFIKVMKLVGTVIYGVFSTAGEIIYNFASGAGEAIAGFANAFWSAMKLDRAGVDEGIERVKKSFVGKLDAIAQHAKDSGAAIDAAFNDIGAPSGDPAAAPKAVNAALKEQLALVEEISDSQKRANKEADDAITGQIKELKAYQDQLDAIRGKKSEKKEASMEDLNERLAGLMKLRSGGGVIASSSTQMGFGGRAVGAVSQSKIEQLISETNKKMDERKALESAIVAKMDKILNGLL